MKVKYLIFAIAFALLNVGCSEKKETPNDLNKQSEETKTVLEDSSNVVEPMPREPKYQTKGCLQGCRGLPCDETARCVQRNCPNVKVMCDDDGHGVFKDKEKKLNVNPHEKILCQKGCGNIQKNSAEYENCVLRNCPSAKFVR